MIAVDTNILIYAQPGGVSLARGGSVEALTHGVRELWSADRDFSRFPVPVRNPLLA